MALRGLGCLRALSAPSLLFPKFTRQTGQYLSNEDWAGLRPAVAGTGHSVTRRHQVPKPWADVSGGAVSTAWEGFVSLHFLQGQQLGAMD